MASKSFCDTCQRRDKTSVASKFCSDCEDVLCAECVNVHNTFKAFASHHVVDINLATDESFTVDKLCNTHRHMILEFYCNDHDNLCCRSCMASDHRTCEKLLPLEVVSKNVKTSTMFQHISADVEQLLETSNQLSEEKDRIKIVLNQSKEIAQKKVAKFKEALLKSINEKEKKCLSEIDSVFSNLSAQTDKETQNIEMKVHGIRDITNQFEFITKHGSESQIFRLLHSIKSDMSNVSKDLEEYIPSMRLSAVNVEETDLLPMIKTLGLVTVKKNPCKIDYKPVKSQQAQMLQNRERVLTRLELETKVTVKEGGNITGICINNDDRLLLCNWGSGCLLALTDKGKYIQKISLSANPWSIAIVPDSDEAWITLPKENYVQIINTTTYIPTRHVKLSGYGYYGITFVDDSVALGGYGKVDIINKQGILTKSLSIGCSTIQSISSAVTTSLYCCEAGNTTLHCINLEGSSIFTYSSPQLGGPIAVTQDSSGNLYVLTSNMNNLQKISASGQLVDTMLKKENGLCAPYCLSFSRDHSKLFIPNRKDNKLLIFDCIYTPAI